MPTFTVEWSKVPPDNSKNEDDNPSGGVPTTESPTTEPPTTEPPTTEPPTTESPTTEWPTTESPVSAPSARPSGGPTEAPTVDPSVGPTPSSKTTDDGTTSTAEGGYMGPDNATANGEQGGEPPEKTETSETAKDEIAPAQEETSSVMLSPFYMTLSLSSSSNSLDKDVLIATSELFLAGIFDSSLPPVFQFSHVVLSADELTRRRLQSPETYAQYLFEGDTFFGSPLHPTTELLDDLISDAFLADQSRSDYLNILQSGGGSSHNHITGVSVSKNRAIFAEASAPAQGNGDVMLMGIPLNFFIGGVAGLAVVAVVAFLFVHKSRKKKRNATRRKLRTALDSPNAAGEIHPSVNPKSNAEVPTMSGTEVFAKIITFDESLQSPPFTGNTPENTPGNTRNEPGGVETYVRSIVPDPYVNPTSLPAPQGILSFASSTAQTKKATNRTKEVGDRCSFTNETVGTRSAHGKDGNQSDPPPGMSPSLSFDPELGTATLVETTRMYETPKVNQDRKSVTYPYFGDRIALFATYDGHGKNGELVAEFVKNEMLGRLHIHPLFQKDVITAMIETFRWIDVDLGNTEELDPENSGSTACVVLLRENMLYVANLGDSRAVLARRRETDNDSDIVSQVITWFECTVRKESRLETIALTKDQTAESEDERNRIIQSGGFVAPSKGFDSPLRVWLNKECTEVGLAMTRSFGDFNAKAIGVIADPVVTSRTIDDRDEFLIIATDGVWEFIEPREAVLIIEDCFHKGLDVTEACSHLVDLAKKLWAHHEEDYRDDITAVVVRLRGIWDDNSKELPSSQDRKKDDEDSGSGSSNKCLYA